MLPYLVIGLRPDVIYRLRIIDDSGVAHNSIVKWIRHYISIVKAEIFIIETLLENLCCLVLSNSNPHHIFRLRWNFTYNHAY